jgi:hypothetical protein
MIRRKTPASSINFGITTSLLDPGNEVFDVSLVELI